MPDQFGRFSGEPVAQWLSGDNRMELREPFWYEDPVGKRWEAPQGHKVNGASIPRVLWTLVGDPFGSNYRNASIVHDVYCDWGNWGDPRARPWLDTHRMFYHACRAGGVAEARAKMMYAAVRQFGPRWKVGKPGLGMAKGAPMFQAAAPESAGQEAFLRALEADLERNPDRSLTEIDEIAKQVPR